MLELAAAVGGGLISGAMNLIGGTNANAANARQASLNREFQETAFKHRYQWTVDDMRKAGLNPALAYQQGGGSAPGGSQAAPMQNALGPAATSAMATAQGLAGIAATGAQIAKTEAETSLTDLTRRISELKSKFELAMLSNQSDMVAAERQFKGSPDYPALIRKVLEADLRLTGASAKEKELDFPRAENEAAMQNTWWKKYIAPFLGDATSISKFAPRR